MRKVVVGLAVLVSLVGCKSAPGTRGNAVFDSEGFPSTPELEALSAKTVAPAPERLPNPKLARFAGEPLPTAEQLRQDEQGPLGQLLLEAGKPARVTYERELGCLAREFAGFYLANGVLPQGSRQAFLSARCGVRVGELSSAMIHGDAEPGETEAQLFARLKPRLQEMATNLMKGEPSAMGATLRLSGGKAIAYLLAGKRSYRLDAPVVRDASGTIDVRGELLVPARQVHGYVTQGELGAAVCESMPGVALPKFHLRCRGLPQDPYSWIDVYAAEHGRFLSNHLADLMAWPTGAAYPELVTPEHEPLPLPADPTGAPGLLLQAVNAARERAKVKPMRLAPTQSARAEKLAPLYFNGTPNEAESEAARDLIALGLMAGWDVDDKLVQGNFQAVGAEGTPDLGDMVATALERPSNRHSLLSADATIFSAGLLTQSPNFLGALVTTYEVYDKSRDWERRVALYARLNKLRKERNKPQLWDIDQGAKITQRYADLISAGQIDEETAMNNALEEMTQLLNRPIKAWILHSHSVDEVQFPTELVEDAPLAVDMAFAYVRKPGQAWGSFVILILVGYPDGPATAGGLPRSSGTAAP